MLQAYPVELIDHGQGGVMARFPDVPSAITEAPTRAEALAWAQDALLVALSGYLEDREGIPTPSVAAPGQELVPLPPLAAIKLAIYTALRAQGVSQQELAHRLGCDARQVRRILDLDHNSRLDLLNQALRALGKSLVIQVRDAS